jgi:transposase
MLEALISGTHDPETLAGLAYGAPRRKLPRLREALEGGFTGHHALIVSQMLASIDFLDETVAMLSELVEALVTPFSRQVELLDTIPGVNRRSAELLLAEIGADMSRFASHRHLASWAGLCPPLPRPRPGLFHRRQAQHAERYKNRLVRQLERLGHKVTIEPLTEAA